MVIKSTLPNPTLQEMDKNCSSETVTRNALPIPGRELAQAKSKESENEDLDDGVDSYAHGVLTHGLLYLEF